MIEISLTTEGGRVLAQNQLRPDRRSGIVERAFLIVENGHGRDGYQLRVEVTVHNGIPMISEAQFAAHGETL